MQSVRLSKLTFFVCFVFSVICEDVSTECQLLSSVANICSNYTVGKALCKQYCGYCNI